MNRKLLRIGLFLSLLGPTLAVSQTVDKIPDSRKEIIESMTKIISQRAFVPGVDFKKFNSFLEAQRQKIDEAKNDDEFKFAVNTALKKFGFSHISLATPKDWNTRTTGKTVGIGITSLPRENGRVITRVIEQSPAAEAGLEVGDLIILYDGQKISEQTAMTGEEGSIAKIRVQKQNGKTFDYEIKRRPFSTVRKDELKWIDKTTAMLRVNTFDRAYNKKVIAELMAEAVKAKNLVIDLRSNGGGAVLNLFDFAGYFLDPQLTLGSFLETTALRRFQKEQEREPKDLNELIPYTIAPMSPNDQALKYKGNVTVLINEGTASASEIFASAMKEQYGRFEVDSSGTLIVAKENFDVNIAGTKSGGAVLFSTYSQVSNGFYLQFPVGDYLTPNGYRLEGKPIEPDVKIEEPKEWVKDAPDPAIDVVKMIFERIRLRQERAKKGSGIG
jgi:carboxyl-terminal processing protease